jgi:hypothetical protein
MDARSWTTLNYNWETALVFGSKVGLLGSMGVLLVFGVWSDTAVSAVF